MSRDICTLLRVVMLSICKAQKQSINEVSFPELGVILDSTRLLHVRAQNQKMGDTFMLTSINRAADTPESEGTI